MDEEGVGRKYKAAFDAMNVDDLLSMSLLKDTDNTEIIAKYVPVCTQTVDALGRMYLSVIWGWDHFTEVFGDKEISDFSDQTIELFKDLGAFVQFLKHRDIKDTAVIEVGDTSDLENDATLEL
ncbi:hypothetical protein FACS1894170_08990 [Planctomycetales bacterium]|nr:hypothetical protein FACS1894170_08990 [Planctomycetales bacterium]